MNRRILISAICLFFSFSVGLAGCESPRAQKKVPADTIRNSQTHSAPFEEGRTVRVLWTVSGYLIPRGAAMTDPEARQFLFKPLDIGDSWITFSGQTCRNVSFRRKSASARDYFKNTLAIEPEALGIPDQTVEVFTTSCELPGFNEYVRLKDRRLLIQKDGVFFYFSPAANY